MRDLEKNTITSTKIVYEHWSDVLNIPHKTREYYGLIFPPSVITYTSDGQREWLSIGFDGCTLDRIYRESKKENIFLMDTIEKGRYSRRESMIDRLNTLDPHIIQEIVNAIDMKTGKMFVDFLNPESEIKDICKGDKK